MTSNTDTIGKIYEQSLDVVIEMESVATNDELPSKSSKVSDSLISSDTRRQQFLTNLQSMLRQQASNDQQNQLPMLTKDKFVELFLKEVSLPIAVDLMLY